MQSKALGLRKLTTVLTSSAAIVAVIASLAAPTAPLADSQGTLTPIKHVIIVVGENRSFDHIYATYKPARADETVLNLLSKGIVKADGAPGPNYGDAIQYQASDAGSYSLNPLKRPWANNVMPPALTGGPRAPYVCAEISRSYTRTSCDSPANEAFAKTLQIGLPDSYYKYMLTGGTGQASKVPDARISYDGHGASSLPPGPFQITSASFPYDAYAAGPVHRFFQMWQQLDCSAGAANNGNGWGCLNDLFPWVEATVGSGSNGKAPPSPFTLLSTGEGSTAMGFYNVQRGDAPYFKELADTYTLSDNYHQPVMGGTGANSIMLGHADLIWFSDGAGNPLTPPNAVVDPAHPGVAGNQLSEIENPNPQPGANNYYTQDGYGGGSGSPTASAPKGNYGGGSYVNCADSTQPGVQAVLSYLSALPNPVKSRCQAGGYYYLLNNYNPGYFGDGANAYADTNAANTVFTIPPSNLRNIGDLLNDNHISWAYFGDQWDQYLGDKYGQKFGSTDKYCNICNWAQYSTSIMTSAAQRAEHLRDTKDFYAAVKARTLPAVSYVKPSGYVDGHPDSSKLILFEGFAKYIVDAVRASPLWKDTVIFITVDEGGGYYDSGYVQPLDFFGDGPRIPLIAVSRFSAGGRISHRYADHVSILKFIEANWGLGPITNRSRDNLPNPQDGGNPYIPVNSPAISDLMDMFKFDDDKSKFDD